MLMYAVDIYFWKRYRVNYPFIFNFKQGSELGYREVFLLSAGLAVLALASFLANFNLLIGITVGDNKNFAKLIPVLVLLVRREIRCNFSDTLFTSSKPTYLSSKCYDNCVAGVSWYHFLSFQHHISLKPVFSDKTFSSLHMCSLL